MTATARAPGLERGETTVSPNGIDLYLRWVKAPKPKGAVLLVHGVGEHGGRYEHLERALTSAGWSFYTYDHRGHGRSKGRRVHVERFDDYVDDLQKVFDEVKSLHGAGGTPGVAPAGAKRGPVFVIGHSMGGLVVATWATLRKPAAWGVVIDSPPFKLAVQVPAVKIAAAKVLSKIVPQLALANEVDPKLLSRDPSVAKAYLMDPLVERKATVRWGDEFLRAIDRVNARAHELDIPYLMMHGDCDGICSHEGTKEFHSKTASADKTLKIYPGCFHELHNEASEDREKVFADLLAWLDARA